MAFKKLLQRIFGGDAGGASAEVAAARKDAQQALASLRGLAEELRVSASAYSAAAHALETAEGTTAEEDPQRRIEAYASVRHLALEGRGQLLLAHPRHAAAAYVELMRDSVPDVEPPSARTFSLVQLAAMQAVLGDEEDSEVFLARALAACGHGEQVTSAVNGLVSMHGDGGVGDKWTSTCFDRLLASGDDERDPAEQVVAASEVARGRVECRDLPGALAVAEGIEDPWYRERAYASILETHAKSGTLDGVEELAARIEDAELLAPVTKHVVFALAAANEFDAARARAATLEDPEARGAAEREIAELLARAGKHDDALAYAAEIESDSWRTDAYQGIAEACAEKGERVVALDALQRIEDPAVLVQSMHTVAFTLTQRGDLDAARELIEGIEEPVLQRLALGTLAREEAKAGQAHAGRGEASLATLARAVDGASRLPGMPHDVLMSIIAEVHLWNGDLDAATAALGEMEQPQSTTQLLHRLGRSLADAKRLDLVEQILARYREPLGRTWLLLGATSSLLRRGD